MTWDEWDEVQKFRDKLGSGADLSREEIMRLLLLLTKGYIERGQE